MDDRIRVVHVITRFDKGGSAENTFLTVAGLDRNRYDVSLITGAHDQGILGAAEEKARKANLAVLQAAGIKVFVVPELVRNIDPPQDLRALGRLRRLLREIRPHIVHTHTSKAGIIGRLAAYLNKVPIIVHTPHGHVFWGYFGPLTSRFFIFLEKFAALITDRLVMLTEEEQGDHIKRRIAAPGKFIVIHSGVRLEPFLLCGQERERNRQEMGIPEGAFVIGTVGRLTAVKGQRYLLEGAAMLSRDIPDLYCLLLGDGELREELENMAAALAIGQRVVFAGWREDVAAVMAVFDVFVLPSLNEGMGRVLVEAMAAGKAIVAADVGGIRNLVVNKENGILVPPAEPEALSAAVYELYREPERMRRLGEAGRQRAAAFSDTAMIEKIDDLYRMLIMSKYDNG